MPDDAATQHRGGVRGGGVWRQAYACPRMKTDDLDFHLPSELIAQVPTEDRAASRLLHYRRDTGAVAHRKFADLPALLRPGDVLVFNDARVTPARFYLRKPTGGRIEGLYLGEMGEGVWSVMLRDVASLQPGGGTRLSFENASEATAMLLEKGAEGVCRIRVAGVSEPAEPFLERIGRMPLPPYIRRGKGTDPHDELDRERYQTVYAKVSGSVAAPTAGLHFTPKVLEELDRRGVIRATVTLHVGLGTFKPVTAESLEGHTMHVERYTLPAAAAGVINAAKRDGRRVIAVGTTSARVLESQPEGELSPVTGETGIFIYPPYRWKHMSGLVTNFHLPRSTLIALVAAWVGLDAQRRIYAEAITAGYRFFSYGDSSFLE